MSASTMFDSGDSHAVDPIDRVGSRPDFAVLAYPVISMSAPWTHQGSRQNLLGSDPDAALAKRLSGEFAVTSRTYTSVIGGGTYGQSIDPVAAWSREAFVPGLRMTSTYRSNVGFVNGGDAVIGVDVRLISPFGVELGRTTISLAAKSQIQYSVAALFPSATSAGTFTLQATASAPTLFAYGSMVDNDSGDPVFFGGR